MTRMGYVSIFKRKFIFKTEFIQMISIQNTKRKRRRVLNFLKNDKKINSTDIHLERWATNFEDLVNAWLHFMKIIINFL